MVSQGSVPCPYYPTWKYSPSFVWPIHYVAGNLSSLLRRYFDNSFMQSFTPETANCWSQWQWVLIWYSLLLVSHNLTLTLQKHKGRFDLCSEFGNSEDKNFFLSSFFYFSFSLFSLSHHLHLQLWTSCIPFSSWVYVRIFFVILPSFIRKTLFFHCDLKFRMLS
jgi:hypothetical protein